ARGLAAHGHLVDLPAGDPGYRAVEREHEDAHHHAGGDPRRDRLRDGRRGLDGAQPPSGCRGPTVPGCVPDHPAVRLPRARPGPVRADAVHRDRGRRRVRHPGGHEADLRRHPRCVPDLGRGRKGLGHHGLADDQQGAAADGEGGRCAGVQPGPAVRALDGRHRWPGRRRRPGLLRRRGLLPVPAVRQGAGGRHRHHRPRGHARPNRPVRRGPLRPALIRRNHVTRSKAGRLTRVALAAVIGLTVAACGGNIQNAPTPSGGGQAANCGKLNMAINPWVGYEASAHVVGYIAKTKLGCEVEYKNVKEEVAWQGMGNGEVDVVIENWGHPDLVQKYITEQKTAQDAGPNGNIGVIGWYVPPWLAKQYPDITDWNNLNKYADMFKSTESGGQGQLLDGDPSFVTNDEALVTNLKLNYKVVYAGSEPALIQAFRQGEQNKKPVIGYFYAPQWFLSEVPLVK